MNDVKCTIIQDLLPLYVDKVCSSDSAELVKNHLQSCTECKKIYDEMTADLEGELPCPEVDGKKAFQSLRTNLLWITVALAVMVGCFVANIGGAWMGGAANIGQFIATILYIIFWGVFTIMTRKYGVLVKVSFILSLLTFIGAFNSLVMRLLSEGWILAALISAFASVPFYGLRLLMDWTALYAVATVISIVWLIYAGMNLRKHQKSLKK